MTSDNPFSHNHGSGKVPQMKGTYYWRDPFFTSMIMGGRVFLVKPFEGLAGLPKFSPTFWSEENVDASNLCIQNIWKTCPFPRYK